MSGGPHPVAPTLLDVRDLVFAYPGGEPVLRGVTFSMAAGERVALLGANGAGKSTLILHLNGLLLPTAGSVAVSGIPVRDGGPREGGLRDGGPREGGPRDGGLRGGGLREVRRRVGMVFQDADDQLFLPTLLEDVAFAPLNDGATPADAAAAAEAQLAELGLAGRGERAAHHLSGGERRLAALATVLVTRPELLVLDEPTSGLDARARQRVVHLLRARPEALLLATHDLEAARALCTRGVVLADGRVVADAPLPTILADGALLERHGLTAPL